MPDARAPQHPRPQLRRRQWASLDGEWRFALDPAGRWRLPAEVEWDRTIRVPFAPETEASGIAETGFYQACWYRRRVPAPALDPGERLHLHFGAVDWEASVWANGRLVARHEGGYTPFTADVTDAARESAGGEIDLVVRAGDDPHDLAKPRGKQDWQLHPHSIWYPRTTGIWQTVWSEAVPATRFGKLRWTPTLDRYEVGLEALIDGEPRDDLRLRVKLTAGPLLLADDTYRVTAGELHRGIDLSDPGIEDYRNELLWSPERPTLIQAHLQLLDEPGSVLDEAWSYTALRSIAVQGDRFVLNGRPLPLRLVLDQGYWPGSGQDRPRRRGPAAGRGTGQGDGLQRRPQAPEDRGPALPVLGRRARPAWCGRRCRAPTASTPTSVERLTKEWAAVIDRDRSHPCIVAWVPFNESWGVPDLPDSPTQRHYVQALYHLTKTLDPTRPVVGNDGWESVATDVIGIHDYDDRLAEIARRYGAEEGISRLFRRERPGGRMLILGDTGSHPDHPVVLTEFGGIAYSPADSTWGYSRAGTAADFGDRYAKLLAIVRSLPVLAGYCYTQFADTYQEANGLLFADRTPKFPIEEIARATRGPANAREYEAEQVWREGLMRRQRTPQEGQP